MISHRLKPDWKSHRERRVESDVQKNVSKNKVLSFEPGTGDFQPAVTNLQFCRGLGTLPRLTHVQPLGSPNAPRAVAGLVSLTFAWPDLCSILSGVWVRDTVVFSSFNRGAGKNARVTTATLLPFLVFAPLQ
jgi:hypothetical protein